MTLPAVAVDAFFLGDGCDVRSAQLSRLDDVHSADVWNNLDPNNKTLFSQHDIGLLRENTHEQSSV